jgi:hypothetical protein
METRNNLQDVWKNEYVEIQRYLQCLLYENMESKKEKGRKQKKVFDSYSFVGRVNCFNIYFGKSDVSKLFDLELQDYLQAL